MQYRARVPIRFEQVSFSGAIDMRLGARARFVVGRGEWIPVDDIDAAITPAELTRLIQTGALRPTQETSR